MNVINLYQSFGRMYLTSRKLLVIVAAIGATSARSLAQTSACSAISADDVSPIVGGAASKASPLGCSWRGIEEHYVMVFDNTPHSKLMAVSAMYLQARKAAEQIGTVNDESGLGDKAFLAVATTTGVTSVLMLKGERLLQVQLWTGDLPTSGNLDLIRKIAKKAIAKF